MVSEEGEQNCKNLPCDGSQSCTTLGPYGWSHWGGLGAEPGARILLATPMAEHDKASDTRRVESQGKVPELSTAECYLTIEQFAELSTLSVPTLRRLVKKAAIDAIQPGGPRTRVLFRRDALENLRSPRPTLTTAIIRHQ